MQEIAIITILVYAAIVALGGLFGYVKGKSKASLAAGLVSAALLIGSWFITRTYPLTGMAASALIVFALFFMFLMRFTKTRSWMPAGAMAAITLLAAVLIAAGILMKG